MPVFLPAFFEERRHRRRRGSLKGYATDAASSCRTCRAWGSVRRRGRRAFRRSSTRRWRARRRSRIPAGGAAGRRTGKRESPRRRSGGPVSRTWFRNRHKGIRRSAWRKESLFQYSITNAVHHPADFGGGASPVVIDQDGKGHPGGIGPLEVTGKRADVGQGSGLGIHAAGGGGGAEARTEGAILRGHREDGDPFLARRRIVHVAQQFEHSGRGN